MKAKGEKALFVQRFIAFLLDIFILSSIASLISYPFLDAKSIDKLNKNSSEVIEKYTTGEIDMDTYVDEVKGISYQLSQKQGVVSLVTLFLAVLYFIVYQYYNNGQTIGKKLMKIKVVSSTDKEITMNSFIFRSLIVNSILVDMISFAIVIFGNETAYFYGVAICGIIKYTLLLICGFMVMWSKSGLGLHDRIAHTTVVKA
ncbi:MAG: RDD family protein [Bacilli bacterium]|nr:RDD family protein [bacterium]MDY5992937.1 RDD family protein [Bacilli bacterium]